MYFHLKILFQFTIFDFKLKGLLDYILQINFISASTILLLAKLLLMACEDRSEPQGDSIWHQSCESHQGRWGTTLQWVSRGQSYGAGAFTLYRYVFSNHSIHSHSIRCSFIFQKTWTLNISYHLEHFNQPQPRFLLAMQHMTGSR